MYFGKKQPLKKLLDEKTLRAFLSIGAFYSGKDNVYLQVKTVIKNFLLTVTKWLNDVHRLIPERRLRQLALHTKLWNWSLLPFYDVTTGFSMKWCLRNRNSIYIIILMTCHNPEMGSASDWFKICFNQSEELPKSGWWPVISMEFLHIRCHFVGKPTMMSRNVSAVFLG